MQPDQEIAHEVLRAIRRIVRRISEHSKALSRGFGLTVPQLMCLKTVGELSERFDETTLAMVARDVQLSPPTVSRIIDRLTRAGLVLRERRSADRRRVCLSLTPAGQERFRKLPVPLQDRFIHRLLGLPEQERFQLLGALQRITELMEADELDAAPILTPGANVQSDPPPS